MQNLPLEQLMERSTGLLWQPLLSDGDKVMVVSYDLTIAADIVRDQLFVSLSSDEYRMSLQCLSPSHSESEWTTTTPATPYANLPMRLVEHLWQDAAWWESHQEEMLNSIPFPTNSFMSLWLWDDMLGGRNVLKHLEQYQDNGTRGDFARLVRFLYFSYDQD